jgi:nitroimidazol reductase NimA-like FMN-containing flavoprotein (pyridoxamine 5'-phosphate oxidase superfamily)
MREESDRTQVEILPRPECFRLLASQTVGRLGFVVGDQPLVLPINFAVVRDVVVFRTGRGSKLGSALGTKVCFEVDEADAVAGGGWSVVVQGVAEEITHGDHWFDEALRRGAATTWISGGQDHYVRIIPHVISGRRLIPPDRPTGPGGGT